MIRRKPVILVKAQSIDKIALTTDDIESSVKIKNTSQTNDLMSSDHIELQIIEKDPPKNDGIDIKKQVVIDPGPNDLKV